MKRGSNDFIGRELYWKESKGLSIGDLFPADGGWFKIIGPNAVWFASRREVTMWKKRNIRKTC